MHENNEIGKIFNNYVNLSLKTRKKLFENTRKLE